ncbi:MAG: nuclear transport factor 2 family protein [Mycobacterium sp.]|uniref:YybH family protein n=1 Tax=Mycobacterium sp. TaxID=1785 RepID=UPI003BB20E23
MTGFSDLAPDDQQAIGKTLLTLLTGFRNRDADALRAVYSDDADWVNAFGTVKRGREEIVDYLRHLFVDGNFELIVSEMFQDANTETTYAQ